MIFDQGGKIMSFCTHCGGQAPEDAAFCGLCGRAMTRPSTSTNRAHHLQKEPVARHRRTVIAMTLLVIVMLVAVVFAGGSRVLPLVFSQGSSSPRHTVRRVDTQAAFAPYVGTWERHVTELVIKADGTGTEVEGFGFICDNGTKMCGMNATLRFLSAPVEITGTYISISYSDSSYQPASEDPHVGDSFRLTLLPHDMLNLVWSGTVSHRATESFCGPKTTAPWYDACGA
jgi:hypothetical protein